MTRKCYHLGNICYSRFYIDLEIKPSAWFFSFKPTYVGTKAGMLVGFGIGSIMAHMR